MRNFKATEPEVMRFTLDDDETVYELPLGGSLPLDVVEEVMRIQRAADEERDDLSFRFQVRVLKRYLGDDVAGSLTVDQASEIFAEWAKLSNESGGDLGE